MENVGASRMGVERGKPACKGGGLCGVDCTPILYAKRSAKRGWALAISLCCTKNLTIESSIVLGG